MTTTCFVMLICVCVLSFLLGSASSVSFQEFTLLAQGNDYNDVLNVMEQCDEGVGYSGVPLEEWHMTKSLLDTNPPKFLSNFNNPCWFECTPSKEVQDLIREHKYNESIFTAALLKHLEFVSKSINETWRIRCLPKFYLLGVAKAGTTDLFSRLSLHPDITSMGYKEIHFWSNRAISTNDAFDLERYIDLAEVATEQIQKTHVYDANTESIRYPVIFGDASPNTLFKNGHWEEKGDQSNPKLLTPKYLHHVQPDAKLIISLREPASMIFSSYKYFTKDRLVVSVDNFHHCVLLMLEAFIDCEIHHSRTFCTFQSSAYFDIVTETDQACYTVLLAFQRCQYDIYISHWLEYFNHENLHVIRFEDTVKDPRSAVVNIWKFLGLRELPKVLLKTVSVMDPVNHQDSSIGAMREDTYAHIRNFFEVPNAKLAELLDNDIYLWHD